MRGRLALCVGVLLGLFSGSLEALSQVSLIFTHSQQCTNLACTGNVFRSRTEAFTTFTDPADYGRLLVCWARFWKYQADHYCGGSYSVLGSSPPGQDILDGSQAQCVAVESTIAHCTAEVSFRDHHTVNIEDWQRVWQSWSYPGVCLCPDC
jgi:hypothetical protein